MIINAEVTLYNRTVNPGTRKVEYFGHMSPCHYYCENKVITGDKGDGGLKHADVFKIRIPAEYLDGYVAPDEYAKLPYSPEMTAWTVEKEDLFILGTHDLRIKGIGDLQKTHRPYGMVDNYGDNRKRFIPHIRFGGCK